MNNFPSTYIFGYGSLIFPGGINNRGMEYKYTETDLSECILHGYNRDWNAEAFGTYRFLGITKNDSALNYHKNVPGVIFKIHSKEDYEALKRSENGDETYKYVNVAQDLEYMHGRGMVRLPNIITCVTRSPSYKHRIHEYYKRVVLNGLSKRSSEFRKLFGKDKELKLT